MFNGVMRPYLENKHQLGATGEESCEQCALCLFCSQADGQVIMNDTPLRCMLVKLNREAHKLMRSISNI